MSTNDNDNNHDPQDAIPLLLPIALDADDPDASDAQAIIKNITDMTAIPDDCLNHMADSWGQCENCGRSMW
jgi:hypothetical protein